MRPKRSDSVPATMRPAALKSASTDTAVAASETLMPTIFWAIGEAWEVIMRPLNAPQVSITIIT